MAAKSLHCASEHTVRLETEANLYGSIAGKYSEEVTVAPESTPSVPADSSQEPKSDLKTLSWTSSTYFAEGLPWSLLHQVAAEFFTTLGVSPAKIGATSLLHGPTLLKVIWSPVVELYGSLRGWMVATQAALGVLTGVLALLAHGLVVEGPGADTTVVWIVLFAIGIGSAVHDIACDGYYMEALDTKRQALFSGMRVAAFRAAMLVGSSGLVFLGGRYSWFLGFLTGAGILLALAGYHLIFLPKPEQASASEGTNAPRKALLSGVKGAYSSFINQEAAWVVIGFLLTYKMADVLLFSMSRVMFGRELGIGADLRGVIGLFSTVASILGAILGGAWISKRGLAKTLVPITLLMAVTEPLYALLASQASALSIFHGSEPASTASFVWATDGMTVAIATLVIVVEQLCGGLATAAQMVFIMRRCNVRHRTAHFAFATAVYSLAQMAMGYGSGFAYQELGSVSYFWVVSVLTLPAVFLSLVVPKD